jgi:hypothetical protein
MNFNTLIKSTKSSHFSIYIRQKQYHQQMQEVLLLHVYNELGIALSKARISEPKTTLVVIKTLCKVLSLYIQTHFWSIRTEGNLIKILVPNVRCKY